MKDLSTTEAELEHRRVLLQLAARGNAAAQKELEDEYHVRVYSAAERARYRPDASGFRLPGSVQRKVDTVLYSDTPLL